MHHKGDEDGVRSVEGRLSRGSSLPRRVASPVVATTRLFPHLWVITGTRRCLPQTPSQHAVSFSSSSRSRPKGAPPPCVCRRRRRSPAARDVSLCVPAIPRLVAEANRAGASMRVLLSLSFIRGLIGAQFLAVFVEEEAASSMRQVMGEAGLRCPLPWPPHRPLLLAHQRHLGLHGFLLNPGLIPCPPCAHRKDRGVESRPEGA